MEMLVVLIALAIIPLCLVSFIFGRNVGVQKVCHTGVVKYGVTGDKRFAMNLIFKLDKSPYKLRIRVPQKDSLRIAMALLNSESVELDGGEIGDRATLVPRYKR